MHVVDNVMYVMYDGRQPGRPEPIYAGVLIIADNTNKEKKRTKNITYNSIISLQPWIK